MLKKPSHDISKKNSKNFSQKYLNIIKMFPRDVFRTLQNIKDEEFFENS